MPLTKLTETLNKGLQNVDLGNSLKFDCGTDGVIVLNDGAATNTDQDTDCTIKMTTANLEKLIAGKLNPMTAFAMGKIKVTGDMGVAMKLGSLLKS